MRVTLSLRLAAPWSKCGQDSSMILPHNSSVRINKKNYVKTQSKSCNSVGIRTFCSIIICAFFFFFLIDQRNLLSKYVIRTLLKILNKISLKWKKKRFRIIYVNKFQLSECTVKLRFWKYKNIFLFSQTTHF